MPRAMTSRKTPLALLVGVVCVAVAGGGLALATGPTPSRPSDLIAMRLFKTPGNAAYCYLALSLAPENPMLACWTPNDGFVASINHDTTRGYAGYGSARIFRAYTPPRYQVLGFGKSFNWRCRSVDASFAEGCSPTRGTIVFSCASRRTGLTCTNRDGHGFWLGRYRGYRVY
jgi:hypothetical protein